MTEVARPHRVVVVNLDETWNFADLVRRGALDVFADPDTTVEIQFRTLGDPETSDGSAKRRLVWGAERPLIYGRDIDSLTDDLIEDVDDLVASRISDLALVVVLPDPEASSDGTSPGRPEFLERLEEEIFHRSRMIERPPRRWICVRDRAGAAVHPRFDALVDALTFDPTMAHRQIADRVFRLRSPRVGDPDLEVDKRHFLALRVVVAVAVDTFPNRAADPGPTEPGGEPAARSSPIGELIRAATVFEVLLPGAPAPTTSAAVAQLLDGHRRAAEAATPGIRPRVDGDDPTARRVEEVLAAIRNSMLVPGQETTPASTDRKRLDDRANELRALARRWWTAEGESAVTRLGEETLGDLRRYVQDRITQFTDYRATLENRIATEFDARIRGEIRSIPMVGGGLSGASAVQLERIRSTVRTDRKTAEEAAEVARAEFMGVLLPIAAASGSRVPARAPQPATAAPRLDLDRIDAYRAAVEAHAGLRTIYRRLVPRPYLWALVGLVAAAHLTLVAHVVGKSRAWATDLVVAYQTRSAAVGIAVIAASLLSMIWFTWSADRRRKAMVEAVDAVQKRHAVLWGRVIRLTDAAFTYVTVSRHILYFRLLEEEIERRRREEDTSALDIAFEDIARQGAVRPVVAAERAAAHAVEMTSALSTLPPIRWFRHMLERSSTFEAACPGPRRLRFVVKPGEADAASSGGASGTFHASATVFQREQTVEISIVATDRPPLPRDRDRPSGGTA